MMAVLVPAILCTATAVALNHIALPARYRSTVVVIAAAICGALLLLAFLSVRRLVSPMEKKLNNYERQRLMLAEIVERSPLGVVSFDREGKLLYANDNAYERLGIRRALQVPVNLFDHLAADEHRRLEQAMQRALIHGMSDLELELAPSQGTAAPQRVAVYMAARLTREDRTDSYFYGIIIDADRRARSAPASPGAPAEAEAPEPRPAMTSSARGCHDCRNFGGAAPASGRVLLVEDHEISREVAQKMLEHIGAEVATAAHTAEAMRLLAEEGPFELILMDLHMPVLDGIAAVRLIRANPDWRSIPIVMLTADATREQHRRCYEAGVQQVVTKPIETKRLREVLDRWTMRDCRRDSLPSLGEPTDSEGHSPHLSKASQEPHELYGLDTHQALSRLNGDRTLYVRLLEKLSARYGDVTGRLADLLARGETREAIRIVHALRGATSHLAAMRVYEAASRLEEWLVRDERAELLLNVLERELQAVFRSIEKYKKSISLPNNLDTGGDSP